MELEKGQIYNLEGFSRELNPARGKFLGKGQRGLDEMLIFENVEKEPRMRYRYLSATWSIAGEKTQTDFPRIRLVMEHGSDTIDGLGSDRNITKLNE